MLLKVVIAEDDDILRRQLISVMSSLDDIDIVYTTDNGTELFSVLKKIKPDLLISDIDMPGMSAIEAVKLVRDEIPTTEIIFVTAFDQYIKDAIQLYAVDYIEKPLNIQRLMKTIDRIKTRLITNDKLFEFKSEHSVIVVRARDLYFVEAIKKKTRIYTGPSDFVCSFPLKEVEEMLKEDFFYKSSRSYIVNLKKIHSITPFSRTSFKINFAEKDWSAFLSKNRFEEFRTILKKFHQ